MANGFASPSISLPSVGTSFATSESKALVPYSPSGIMDNVKKLSPLESMQEVFYDIRDGIENLGNRLTESINNQTGLLNSTLLGVIHTLSNIGNIAAKDLDIEKATAKIAAKDLDIKKATAKEAAENEARKEKGEALGDKKGEGKGKGLGILGSIKNAFSSVIEALTPKSEGMKVGLIGLLTLGIMTQLDKLEKIFEGVFKFISENIIPAAKRFWAAIKDDFGPAWEGIVNLFSLLTGGISDIWEGFKTDDPVKKLEGLKKLFFDLPIKFVAVVGDALAGLIDAVLQMFGIDAPWIKDIQMAFRTLPEAIDKVITDTMKFFTDGFDKLTAAYTEGGLIGAVGEGFRMFYDNTVGLGLNLLYDMYGAILKLFGAEELGEWFQNADFTFDGIKNAFTSVTNKIKGAFDSLVNGMKAMANAVIDKINILLPKKFEIKKLDITETMVESADGTTSLPLKEVKTVNTPPGLAEELKAKDQTKTQEFNETYVDNIVKQSNIMKEKETELKKAVAAKGDTTPGNVTIMTDAKRVSGDTVAVSNTNVTNQRVDSIELSSNELLNYFRN